MSHRVQVGLSRRTSPVTVRTGERERWGRVGRCLAEKLHLGSSNPVIGLVHFLIPCPLLVRVEDLLGNSV